MCPLKIKIIAIDFYIVLDMTLKGIQVVYDSITEEFFRAPGPRTKYFEHSFFVVQ